MSYLSDLKEKSDAKRAKNKEAARGCFGFIILLIIIVTCKMIFSDDTKPYSIVSNSEFDASVWQVESYLKHEYLKDPDSYESIEWSAVVTDTTKKESSYKYFVRHKYRAKNSFGGYEIENKVFYLDSTGKVINITASWR
jgi:hypothetical protein